jgi:hypothetical protein
VTCREHEMPSRPHRRPPRGRPPTSSAIMMVIPARDVLGRGARLRIASVSRSWASPRVAVCAAVTALLSGGTACGGPPATPSAEGARPERPYPGLPEDSRFCRTDADCVVAQSLAGLDHIPRPGERCEGTCYVGVRREALAAWNSAVTALSPTVPCDREFEPCPPAEHFEAFCRLGTCQVRYVGERTQQP